MSDQTNSQQPVQEEPSLSELLQIRRDKLTALQEQGQDPFVITKYKGLDPEVFGGIDNNVYPRPTTFTLGLVATF